MEFCFDEAFEPEMLGELHPTQRYLLWCHKKDRPASFLRKEEFTVNSSRISGRTMPFGMPTEELIEKVKVDRELTDTQRDFAKRMEPDPSYFQMFLRFPHFLRTSYTVDSLRDMLYLEFTKMLEENIRVRKCARCGRYFILKGNYATQYCSRVVEGGTRTCQQLAAQENYQAKVKGKGGENAWGIFQRYYKRYLARAKVGTIKESTFKQWQYQAVVKRDQCNDGALPLADYLQWMENSFPNQKKKNGHIK